MKKILLLVIVALYCYSVSAQLQVTHAEAVSVALNWYRANQKITGVIVKMDSVRNERGNVLLYEVGFEDFSIILSGNKACRPILATYQSESESVLDTGNSNLPCGVRFLISEYIRRISFCFENGDGSSENESQWKSFLKGKIKETKSVVPPLIQTKWSQSSSNTGGDLTAYNYFCEAGEDSECTHYLVGCGAVAMGQIMRYWNYPILTNHYPKQFDWCNMTSTLDNGIMDNYDISRDAIASFLFHCADDIHTTFGCGRSLSSFGNIRDALVDIYEYQATHVTPRGNNDSAWLAAIKLDIDNGYPVLYRGADENNRNGHFFILDGYDSDGKFHVNWGWGNLYQSFYAYLGDFARQGLNYDFYQYAIFGLHAPEMADYCHQYLSLDNYYEGFYANGSNSTVMTSEAVPQTMTTLTSAPISSPSSWRTIPANATAVYQAHVEVNLQDGFEALEGCEFEARIEPCAMCDGASGVQGGILPDELDVVGDQPDTTVGTVAYAMGQPHELPSDALFPNPTDGPLTLATDGMAQAVFVYTLSGNPVGGWRMNALTETSLSLDVSALAPGVYLLSVTTPNATTTAKIIRR